MKSLFLFKFSSNILTIILFSTSADLYLDLLERCHLEMRTCILRANLWLIAHWCGIKKVNLSPRSSSIYPTYAFTAPISICVCRNVFTHIADALP